MKNKQASVVREYLMVGKTTNEILSNVPNSIAYFDYQRAIESRNVFDTYSKNGTEFTEKQINSYLTFSPRAWLLDELSNENLYRLYDIYGEALFRIRLIDDHFRLWLDRARPGEQILATGGSCALESIDTKWINYLRNTGRGNDIKEYIHDFFECTPTWTQITGALIASKGLSVLYDETFPWYVRLEEYGITNAQAKVQKVYDQIFDAVQRYASLQNPNSQIIRVPFTALNLEKDGYIKSWFKDYSNALSQESKRLGMEVPMRYVPDKILKMWVDYTYIGPKLRQIVLQTIEQMYPAIYNKYQLNRCTIHVRGKQIDHLTGERSEVWKQYFMFCSPNQMKNSRRIDYFLKLDNKNKFDNKKHSLAAALWYRNKYTEMDGTGFAGFLDFTHRGAIAHECLPGGVVNSLQSPLRLHAKNLESMLKLLERYTFLPSPEINKESLVNVLQLLEKEKKNKQKIESLTAYLRSYELFLRIWSRYWTIFKKQKQKKPITFITTTNFESTDDISNSFALIIQRFKHDALLRNATKLQDTNGKKIWGEILHGKLQDLFKSITPVSVIKNTITVRISFKKNDYDFGTTLFELITKQSIVDKDYVEKLRGISHGISGKLSQFSHLIEQVSSENLYDTHSSIKLMPLVNNMLVSYMQQFLFIPFIRGKYIEMQGVIDHGGYSESEKEERIAIIGRESYPVIVRCLRYVFQGGDFPHEVIDNSLSP